jgi:hypothetical protein
MLLNSQVYRFCGGMEILTMMIDLRARHSFNFSKIFSGGKDDAV